jgi:3-phosphoshikimate 1-carboxyvinyltransferase
MLKEFNKINNLSGVLTLPGDKSISHRAVMFSSMAAGESFIQNLSNGEDVKSTINCFKQLGVEFITAKEGLRVLGKGFKNFKAPGKNLDAGNSGTTARLISGILAAQNFESVITGDDSLSKRPMQRIIYPLTKMGANIIASENSTLPIKIIPAKKIQAIDYELPVASAQVKSAVLLAGLHAEEITSVKEKYPTRDHTERMLGLKTELFSDGKISYSSKLNYPLPKEYFIPSDISTASFFIVLALLLPGSKLLVKNVSLNPSRTGILDVLKNMGGKIEKVNTKESSGEPFGDLIITGSSLSNIRIDEKIIPNIIDEIPVLSVAGVFAEGEFIIRHAEELRSKESDRIHALCYNYKAAGLDVEEFKDGFSIKGLPKINSPVLESFHDHRIAMAFAIFSLVSKSGGKVNNFDCVSISNPNFIEQIKSIA